MPNPRNYNIVFNLRVQQKGKGTTEKKIIHQSDAYKLYKVEAANLIGQKIV